MGDAEWLIKLFVKLFLLFTFSECVQGTEAIHKLSKHPVVLIISYDGFRYDYLNKTETPNLRRVKENGVSVPYMKNQFLTATFPNHHSIATGLYIESHGIVANSLYDPLYNKVLNGKINEPGFWNYSSTVLPLWVVNELAGDDRVSGVMMWPGSSVPFGENQTKATHIKKFDRSYPFENRVDDVLSWITHKEKPANLVFLYFDEPDHTAHDFGPEGPQVINQIQRMDNLTGIIMNKLKSKNLINDVNLIFLSDHGMEEVKLSNSSILKYKSIVGNVNNTKYLRYGASPVLQILPVKENETMDIYRAFKEASVGSEFSVYLKTDMPVTKPQWHYSKGRRIMPILLVANPGYVFEDSKKKEQKSIGVHGYDSDHPNMNPYFIASGPLFKSKSVQKPFQNVDIYPLICYIMGIKAPPNNGTLAHTLPLLLSTQDKQKQRSKRSRRERSAGVQILGIVVGAAVVIVLLVGFFLYNRQRESRSNYAEMD